MIFQRDYVLRMIEMMGEFVRKVCSLARDADALAELNEASRRGCGMPLDMLGAAEPDTLAALLEEPQRLFGAELLLLRARVESRTHTDDALLPLRSQAVRLLGTLTETDFMTRACELTCQILHDALDALDADSLLAAAGLCERAGRFDRAVDAWFALLERDGARAGEVARFYDRLEALPDAALAQGGLPRAELAEGRASLAR